METNEYPRCDDVLRHKEWRDVCQHACTCYRERRPAGDPNMCIYQVLTSLSSPAPQKHCPRTPQELSAMASELRKKNGGK